MSFQTLMHQETSRLYSISHIVYFELLLCNVLNSVEICIGGHFLEDFFYYYSQKNISAAANKSLIPYNLIKRAPETQNLQYSITECQLKANQKNLKYSLGFRFCSIQI